MHKKIRHQKRNFVWKCK